jgi:hypothetical protein
MFYFHTGDAGESMTGYPDRGVHVLRSRISNTTNEDDNVRNTIVQYKNSWRGRLMHAALHNPQSNTPNGFPSALCLRPLPFSVTLTERENAFLGTPVAGAAPSSAKCASSTIAFSAHAMRLPSPKTAALSHVTVPPDATQRAGLQGPHAARTQTGRAAPALGRRL